MIRLQDNVPEVYVNESRDFQLFCRLYDCINNGVKFDIDSMIYLFDPLKVNNRMLSLLATKAGFFPKKQLNDMMLRYIISAFPYLMKYKGCKKGIEGAIATVLKADNIYASYSVLIINTDDKGNPIYEIQILVDQEYDKAALKELLDYICPIGYIVSVHTASSVVKTTELDEFNIVYMYMDPTASVSQVVDPELNWILPSYTIETSAEPVSQEYINSRDPRRNTVYNEETGDTVTTYIYYEADQDGKYYEKTLTVTIPNNSENRYKGTLERSEVLGITNGGLFGLDASKSDIDKNNGRYPLDNEEYQKDFVKNDIGEGSSSFTEVFMLSDTANVQKQGDPPKPYLSASLTSITYGDIIITPGSKVIPEDNADGIRPSYIGDSFGNLSTVVSCNEATKVITIRFVDRSVGDNE